MRWTDPFCLFFFIFLCFQGSKFDFNSSESVVPMSWLMNSRNRDWVLHGGQCRLKCSVQTQHPLHKLGWLVNICKSETYSQLLQFIDALFNTRLGKMLLPLNRLSKIQRHLLQALEQRPMLGKWQQILGVLTLVHALTLRSQLHLRLIVYFLTPFIQSNDCQTSPATSSAFASSVVANNSKQQMFGTVSLRPFVLTYASSLTHQPREHTSTVYK